MIENKEILKIKCRKEMGTYQWGSVYNSRKDTRTQITEKGRLDCWKYIEFKGKHKIKSQPMYKMNISWICKGKQGDEEKE